MERRTFSPGKGVVKDTTVTSATLQLLFCLLHLRNKHSYFKLTLLYHIQEVYLTEVLRSLSHSILRAYCS